MNVQHQNACPAFVPVQPPRLPCSLVALLPPRSAGPYLLALPEAHLPKWKDLQPIPAG